LIKLDFSKHNLIESDGVFTLKNENTTLGFVRFNDLGEVEYIFVNPIFRKKGLAKRLLKLVREKTGKKLILQPPISPLGEKLLKSVNKWK
jgi:GNAT superfamily N-acetyltransferase